MLSSRRPDRQVLIYPLNRGNFILGVSRRGVDYSADLTLDTANRVSQLDPFILAPLSFIGIVGRSGSVPMDQISGSRSRAQYTAIGVGLFASLMPFPSLYVPIRTSEIDKISALRSVSCDCPCRMAS
jgi:hypothetical protein